MGLALRFETPARGADAVVEALVAAGVKKVFGYPGGAIMPVYDALLRAGDRLQHVLVRHEQGAIHAAQGFARVSRRTGVCIATSGPGATNLVTGLADAMVDSTPLVCITGQVPSHLLGTDAFQETDVLTLTASVTKWSVQVSDPNEIGSALAEAFRVATDGRPGPVLVDITKDAQQGFVSAHRPRKETASRALPRADESSLAQAALLIDEAERPLLIAGQGVLLSAAEDELRAFVERTGIPTASTLLGLSALPSSHPLSVGMLGMHGGYAPNRLTAECDVLVAVGMRFDDRVTGEASRFAPRAKVIHLELDAAEIGKIVPVTVALHGDARDSLSRLLDRVQARTHDAWRARFDALDAEEQQRVRDPELFPREGALRMAEVVRHLGERTAGEAVMVTDVGQHQMITARYAPLEHARTHVTSGGLGTMGFALPAAIGAALASPERPVIAVIGDGGFQMTAQELGTARQSGAPVKVVVLDNGFLGMVRQWQELFFEGRYAHTEMQNPRFVELANAFGVPALVVSTRDELPGAIDAMLAHPGAFLLQVCVAREENVFPMVPPGASVAEVRLER